MKLTGLLTTICLVFGSLALSAQDTHHTLYDYAPLSINPAQAGNFLGTYRIGGIYRDQWAAVSGRGNAFRSPMFYVDAPLPFQIGKKGHWIGAGLNFQLDEAGSQNQKTSTFMLAASFNYVANRKKNTILTIGLQGGSRSRGYEYDPGLTTERGIEQGFTTLAEFVDDDRAIGAFDNDETTDGIIINAGVNLRTNIDKKTHFNIGLGLLNITQPNQSLNSEMSDSTEYNLPMRFNLTAGLRRQLNKKWTLNPTVLISNIRNQNEAALQIWGEYLFNKEKQIDLRFGLGHRLGRDVQPLLGINYGNFRLAAAYDVRLGNLGSALDARGGFEIGVSYIGLIFKKPEVPAVIFCPQF